MKKLLARLKTWRARRRQRRLERWGQTRTKGKAHFVARFAIVWGGTMILVMSLSDYFFDRGYFRILLTVIYFSIAAPILGLVSWWINEGTYGAASIDARMKSIPKD